MSSTVSGGLSKDVASEDLFSEAAKQMFKVLTLVWLNYHPN